ncbi:MAG: hypothetical protein ACXVEX_08340 [Actinomycetota bacterium]
MFRRLSVVVAMLAGLVAGAAAPAAGAPQRHLFVVWLDGTTIEDWSSPALPNFHSVLNQAAIGLLSTRTEHEVADLKAMRASAAVSFGAGARGAADPTTGKPIAVDGVTPGLLGEALARAGYSMGVVEYGKTDTNVALALARADGSLPPVRIVAPTSGHPVNVPDAQLVDLNAITLEEADRVLGSVMKELTTRDLLVVVSGSTTVARQRKGIRLSTVAIEGPGFPAGLLTSGTTRRDGIISITDLAPTIVNALGLPDLSGVDGRVATVATSTRAPERLRSLDRDLVRASLDRRPLTRWAVIAAMLLVALIFAVVWWAGPAPTLGARIPASARDWLATLLVAVVATPLAMYVNGVFHPPSTLVAGIEMGAVALVLAVVARALWALGGSLLAVALLTAAVPLVDLLIGTPLGVRSPLAFQVAGGGRFYGIDGGMLGVVVGAEIVAAALWFERARHPQNAARWIALAFAASVWILGAPSFGSKFGAAPTAVPAFGVLAVVVGGKRFTRASIAAIAVATVVVTGVLIGVDALRTTTGQSHVARAVEGQSNVGAIIARKVRLQWTTTLHTIWTPAILVFVLAIALVLWRRRALVARALEWHTMMRPALLAALVGGIAGFCFNDAGVLVVEPIALFAAALLFSALLVPG